MRLDRDETRQATFEYWTQLQAVIGNQGGLQLDAEQAATDVQRDEAGRDQGPDQSLCGRRDSGLADRRTSMNRPWKSAKELANWYEQGADVLDQAVQVWESSTPGPNGSQLTKEWEQAQAQHVNEGRLLASRVAAVRDSLTRRFGEGFAPFALVRACQRVAARPGRLITLGGALAAAARGRRKVCKLIPGRIR